MIKSYNFCKKAVNYVLTAFYFDDRMSYVARDRRKRPNEQRQPEEMI